jgi:hypothetical protein
MISYRIYLKVYSPQFCAHQEKEGTRNGDRNNPAAKQVRLLLPANQNHHPQAPEPDYRFAAGEYRR